MGKLKDSLLKQLENDPLFADRYWQKEDQQIEPELPKGNDWEAKPSELTLIIPTLWNSGKTNEITPF